MNNRKNRLKINKQKVITAFSRIVRQKLIENGKDISYYSKYGLSETFINSIKNEKTEPNFTEFLLFAEAFGIKYEEFAGLLENEIKKLNN